MFCNKVWQATRFVLMWAVEKNVHNYTFPTPINSTQLWILSRLGDCVKKCNDSFQNYDIYISTMEVKRFFYNEFCDVFVVYIATNKNCTVKNKFLLNLNSFRKFVSLYFNMEVMTKLKQLVMCCYMFWIHLSGS
jgi:valyl-tRNA synthetase